MKHWNIDPESLVESINDAWVFWKNRIGVYLGCNQHMANDLRIPVINVVGSIDHHLPILPKEANFYRKKDDMVIRKNLSINYPDTATISNNCINFTVVKIPILSAKKILGIFGVCYYAKSNEPQNNQKQEEGDDPILPTFTTKQKIIASYLVRGKTAKEIAVLTNTSSRTIEHHIERMKINNNKRNKSELIEFLFNCFERDVKAKITI